MGSGCGLGLGLVPDPDPDHNDPSGPIMTLNPTQLESLEAEKAAEMATKDRAHQEQAIRVGARFRVGIRATVG